jgi:hypothetical protein
MLQTNQYQRTADMRVRSTSKMSAAYGCELDGWERQRRAEDKPPGWPPSAWAAELLSKRPPEDVPSLSRGFIQRLNTPDTAEKLRYGLCKYLCQIPRQYERSMIRKTFLRLCCCLADLDYFYRLG